MDKPSEPSPAPSLPPEADDGVDLTLIEWTLSLTPLERLELLQDCVDGLAELRNGRFPGTFILGPQAEAALLIAIQESDHADGGPEEPSYTGKLLSFGG